MTKQCKDYVKSGMAPVTQHDAPQYSAAVPPRLQQERGGGGCGGGDGGQREGEVGVIQERRREREIEADGESGK